MPLVSDVRWDPRALDIFRTLYQWERWIRFTGYSAFSILLVSVLWGIISFVLSKGVLKTLLFQISMGAVGAFSAVALWQIVVRSSVLGVVLPQPSFSGWLFFLGLFAAGASLPRNASLRASNENS